MGRCKSQFSNWGSCEGNSFKGIVIISILNVNLGLIWLLFRISEIASYSIILNVHLSVCQLIRGCMTIWRKLNEEFWICRLLFMIIGCITLPILLLSLTTMIYCTRPFGQSVKLQKIKICFILKDLSLFIFFDIGYLLQTVCPFIFFCFSINGCCQPCCKI